MAVSVYSGPPGSGKSYNAVVEVILPAVIAGRRVVSNIEGLNPDAVAAMALERSAGKPVGSVVLFHGSDTLEPGFFPDPELLARDDLPPVGGMLQGGDLFVMDEVRLYWPARGAFPPHVMRFFRWHRHWTNPAGVAFDCVLLTQVLTDLHADIRGLTSASFRFKNMSSMGYSGYVWNRWDGPRQAKGEEVQRGTGGFKKQFFALYSSFKGGVDGEVKRTDRRTNIWGSKKIWVTAALLLVGMIGGGIYVVRFFTGKVPIAPGVEQVAQESSAPKPSTALPAPVYQIPPVSNAWRIAGQLDLPSGRRVILADRAGVVRLEGASGFLFVNGEPVSGMVDGERVVASSAAVSQMGDGPKPGLLGGVL